MIKCFLIPSTEPPHTRDNPRRPKYLDDIVCNWSGSVLMEKKAYIVKVAASKTDLDWLQLQEGVIDFPNIDDDDLDKLPKARIEKNKLIENKLAMSKEPGKVREFINRAARVEGNREWDKDKVFIKDIN